MKRWNKNNSFDDIIKNSSIVIFEFGSQDCGACKSIEYKLSSWIEEEEGIEGYYIPVEENLELAAEKGVFTSPVVMVYVNGSMAIREAGYFGLTNIQDSVERYIELLKRD